MASSSGLQAAIGALEGFGVVLDDVGVGFEMAPDGEAATIELTAGRLLLNGRPLQFHNLSVQCLTEIRDGGALECTQGKLTLEHADRLSQLDVSFRLGADTVELTLGPSMVLGGELFVDAQRAGDGWRLKSRLAIPALEQAPAWPALLGWPADLALNAGRLELAVSATDAGGEFELALGDVGWSDESGLRAAEALGATVHGAFSKTGADWGVTTGVLFTSGALIHDALYLESSTPAPSVAAVAVWQPVAERLVLEQFQLEHPGVLNVSGKARVALAPLALESLELTLPRTPLAPLYGRYLQPFAWGTSLEALETDGELALELAWQQGGDGTGRLWLHDLNVEDGGGRFALYGIDGELSWAGLQPGPVSQLGWDGGSVYAFDFGPAELHGVFLGDDFELHTPIELPVFDGLLRINTLDVQNIGAPDFSWGTSAALMPVSLGLVTHTLRWPAFAGTLAGGIPEVRYSDGQLRASGALVMRVFDGDVLIRDLELADVFGVLPELRAKVEVFGLDLAPLTQAFSFGGIQGRLDGRIDDLVLENWRPRSFDAVFQTPPEDSSRRRISQNAVDSLAALGGGAGALSSTFLGFFKTFSYDRLGVRCRLVNGICNMGGVAPAERGYYIVKGGGLPPRIDVLGFNERVAWETLLERLTAVSRGDGPLIR